VRREARDAVLRRSSLPPGVTDDGFRIAAKRLGLQDADAEALLQPAEADADVVALGRAAARIRQDQR
jgi:hypothetical protein